MATIISEVLFQAFYAVLFGTVVYCGLHLGYENFYYYCQVLACTAMLGVMTAFSYAGCFARRSQCEICSSSRSSPCCCCPASPSAVGNQPPHARSQHHQLHLMDP